MFTEIAYKFRKFGTVTGSHIDTSTLGKIKKGWTLLARFKPNANNEVLVSSHNYISSPWTFVHKASIFIIFFRHGFTILHPTDISPSSSSDDYFVCDKQFHLCPLTIGWSNEGTSE